MRSLVLFLFFLAALGAATVQGIGDAPAPLQDNDGGSCGVKLVLKNPDLQEQPDGFIHASGWFFIQFQAVGPGAERVKSFTFSFGKAFPDGVPRCDVAAGRHLTGAYLLNYRGDYTPEDGFFVPINTTLVSDDEYGAAVHAYDQPSAQGNEIGRFYVKAKVENGCTQMQCRDKTTADILKRDKVIPWPRILPGDGVQTNGVDGLTVEFAESVKQVQAFVNGNETALEPWDGVPMDDDVQPGNDAQSCAGQPAQVCTKRVWGPAFKWIGGVEQNDVIRVVATDQNNNRMEKIIHLLDPTQGGIVLGEEVNLDITVENSTQRVGPQQEAEFRFKFISLSASEAHVNLGLAPFDEGKVSAAWHPSHVVVKPGDRASASLIVAGKPGVSSGTFNLLTRSSWRSSGQDVVKEIPVDLVIGSGANAGGAGPANATANGTAGAKAGGGGDTSAPALVTVLSVIVAAVTVVRRRR